MSGRSNTKEVHSTMNLVPYTPAWVAACYGVTVNDPCPVVSLAADLADDSAEYAAWVDAGQHRRIQAQIAALWAEAALTYTVAQANRHSLREGPA